MAEVVIKKKKIFSNIEKINEFLKKHKIDWTLITKVLSGNEGVLEELMQMEIIDRIHSVGESRLSSIKKIKKLRPDIKTMYIKPPAIPLASSIVEYADISLNTSYDVIDALNQEAKKQKKRHSIVIMIEMGELREGILRENILNFYDSVFKLDNIDIIGIGTNLGCMYGVEPTYDKLIQLSLFKELIENRFDHKLPVVSGGSSITLPLVSRNKIPPTVNHFRIGEAAFLGLTPLTGKKFDSLSTDTFTYQANVLELEEKAYVPDGVISEGNVGHATEMDQYSETDKSYKAILDFGILDVDTEEIVPKDNTVSFLGTTSDLTVYDLGQNKKSNGQPRYKVGNKIQFKPTYMGVARLMNSKFIDKRII